MPHRAPPLLLLAVVLLLCGCSNVNVGADKENVAGGTVIGKDGAPMVLVPAGEFLYGDHKQPMSLPAFYMDKYEVTTSRYAKFLQATGRKEPDKWNEVNLVSDGERPVIGVDWYDADAYCRYYEKRLPTEQEWEKAARGTDGQKYPWGNEEPTSHHANFVETIRSKFDPSTLNGTGESITLIFDKSTSSFFESFTPALSSL